MKKSFTILALLVSSSLFCDELAWVDEQIEAIKPPRTGLSHKSLSLIKDPFIFLKKNRGKEEEKVALKAQRSSRPPTSTLSKSKKIAKKVKVNNEVLHLSLIVNKKAMINEHWYSRGEKVNGYTLEEVHPTTVLLAKGKKRLLLSTRVINKNIKFNNK